MTDLLDRLKAALANRYTVERELGRGGMATVYLAEDLKHHRHVAVKVLDPELARALGAERFLREVEVTANLTHPHILGLIDSGEADGFLYYVMPYIEGETLRERMTREGQLPLDDALQLTKDVAAALSYAHSHDVIHRDIKPENILLSTGEAVVADFGIARAITEAGGEHLTETGISIGTPAYMSPEQGAGSGKLDGRSDIYALGCVLYEMLAGEPPYTGPTAQAVLAKKLSAATPRVSVIRERVPPSVEAAIDQALAKAPADRFRTASAFADALLSSSGADALTPGKSIAVLPFANLSTDPDNEYFSDGISEEIINALTQLEGLRVAARSSAFSFKGKNEDLRTVGERLNVSTVLEGSVRKAGSRIRVTAQLINVADGFHLWSEQYDREMDDVFAVQEEIAAAIAERLKITYVGDGSVPLVKAPTANLEAYNLYLRGRFHLYQRAGASLQRGLEAFEQALELDPEYALAHAGVADAKSLLGFYGARRAHDVMPQAAAAARRALELDESLAEAHNALGMINVIYEWNRDVAAEEFQRAIDLNDDFVQAHSWRSFFHLACVEGRFDEAIAEGRRAVELDPLSSYPMTMLALVLGMAGHHEEAVSAAKLAVEREPNSYLTWRVLGVVLRWKGDHADAIGAFESALHVVPGHHWALHDIGLSYAATGRARDAEAICSQLIERAGDRHVECAVSGILLGALHRMDDAFQYLDRACEEKDPILSIARHWPDYEMFRGDPRWTALMRRIGWE